MDVRHPKNYTWNCVQPSPFNYHSFSERAFPIDTQKITKTNPISRYSTAREAMFLASMDAPHLYHTQKSVKLIHLSTSGSSFAWWVVPMQPCSGCASSSPWPTYVSYIPPCSCEPWRWIWWMDGWMKPMPSFLGKQEEVPYTRSIM